ncbi:MAG: cellulase family glycosylhydrolase [bacterium]
MLLSLIAIILISIPTLTLEIQEDKFLIDKKPVFLLGASYYGGLGAADDLIDKDLNELKQHGFNWIRLWATWSAFGNNVSAVDSNGNAREPYLTKLKSICQKADKLGMVVDVTLSRGNGVVGSGLLPSQEAHVNAVKLLAKELKPYRNIYFDIANERNIQDRRHVTYEQLKTLRDQIKEIDPERIVTASHAGDISKDEIDKYVDFVKVDFIAPHRPRHAGSPNETKQKTQEYITYMKERGKIIPVHYQEPFRRGFGYWQPLAVDFLTDLRNAFQYGASGWCLHNGDTRNTPDGRPRRSFDMREGRLFEQLDSEEKEVINKADSIIKM